MYFKQEWKISKPFFQLYRPALVLIYALCGKDWRGFLAVSVSTTALWGTEQKDGGYDTTSCAERSMCVPNSLLHPALTPLLLSPSICPSLFPPVLLCSVTGKVFPSEQGSLEPQDTPPLAVSPCTWIPGERETGKGRRERWKEKERGAFALHRLCRVAPTNTNQTQSNLPHA